MTDGIIFDVDGTLWDMTEKFAAAWDAMSQKEPDTHVRITRDLLLNLFGKPLPVIGAALFDGTSTERQMELLEKCFEEEYRVMEKEHQELYPGMYETLDALSRKYPLFILSNAQSGYIEHFLPSTQSSSFFKAHTCFGDTGLEKCENLRQFIAHQKLLHPVYVGDTDGDHQECIKAGVPFVFASYGYGETKNPDYTIAKPEDLLNLF